MAVSAKMLHGVTYNEDSEEKRSSGGADFDDRTSSGNAFTRFWSSLWDTAVQTRNMNRIAIANGKEPIYKPPGTDTFNAIGDTISDFLGISESSARAFDDALQDGIDKVISGVPIVDAFKEGVTQYKNSTSPQTGVSAKPVVYSDWSPVSRLFGMSQDTAFSEHMANTAHQREVADLKAAGLNPVLGISGSGSSVTSGSVASSGSSSALKADENKFLDIMGATSALVTSLVTKNPMYGYMVANIFKSFD